MLRKISKYKGDIIFLIILCILIYYVVPFKIKVRNRILEVSSTGALLEVERRQINKKDRITISDKDTINAFIELINNQNTYQIPNKSSITGSYFYSLSLYSEQDSFYPWQFSIGENTLSISSPKKNSYKKKCFKKKCFKIFWNKDIQEKLDILFGLEKPY